MTFDELKGLRIGDVVIYSEKHYSTIGVVTEEYSENNYNTYIKVRQLVPFRGHDPFFEQNITTMVGLFQTLEERLNLGEEEVKIKYAEYFV